MNQVILRTHKGEYLPGEDIYGVVYVNITGTTTGRGIRLRFQGCEHFEYRTHEPPEDEKLEAKKHYLDYTDIDLYKSSDLFMIGSYAFPFRIGLLGGIPATFEAERGEDRCDWTAKVSYTLTAELIDAANISTTQSIIVLHPIGISEKNAPPKAVQKRLDIPHMLFFKKSLFVTARLHDHVQQTGKEMKVRIIIANSTNKNVSDITVRLIRELYFEAKGGLTHSKLWKDSNIQETQNRVFIYPERAPHTVWESSINNCPTEILNRGLDNFRIPLTENGGPVLSSVTGHHIKCRYVVEVLVKLENNSCLTTTVPVPCIWHQKNKETVNYKSEGDTAQPSVVFVISGHEAEQWMDQHIPDWVYHTEVVLTESPFSVPENVLSSETFAGIPRFQVLNS